MPIHIERLTSEVSLHDGDFPLGADQVERLVVLVLARLEARQREAEQSRRATGLTRQASAPLEPGD